MKTNRKIKQDWYFWTRSKKTSVVVSVKKESKKYTGSVNETFTLKIYEANADKNDSTADKKGLSTVNKDNFKFLTNFLFRT
ncbi:hypothetical protein FCL65_01660 [Mycoplasma bovis]|nr:hypothetical protein [Mycoplasmopsis bovis]